MRKRRQNTGGVKVRAIKLKHRGVPCFQYELSLPREVAERVPPGSRFTVELIEDGILYRLIKPKEPKLPKLPEWAKGTGQKQAKNP